MPAQGHRKADPFTHRVKVQFTAAQALAIKAHADAFGLTTAAFVRNLVLASLDHPHNQPLPKSRRRREHELTFAEVHELAMQVKKLGVNVNQLAHQANAGMVPLKRAEVIYMLNQHQILMSQAIAAVERAFR